MAGESVGQIGLDLVVNQNQFERQMNGITSIAKKAGATIAGAFAIKKIFDFSKEAIQLGSDLAEVQNVVDVTFTTMSSKVDAFANDAATMYGLSETMAKRFTGTFGAMSKAFGFSEEQAYGMSTALAGLSGDVASFYNLSQDEAYTKLKSVFTGETESLKDLGVVMTQSALDTYAMANGFGKTTKAMSEAEKVALRFKFVQDQLSLANGDFARTSNGWANQVRILKLQMESFMATVGQGLINIFTPVLRVLNSLMGKLREFAATFKALTEALTGKSGASSSANTAAKAVGDVGGAATQAGKDTKKAAKEMKNALAGFDEINVLQLDKGSGSGEEETPDADVGGMDFGSMEGTIGGNVEVNPALVASIDNLKQTMEPTIEAAKRLWEELKRFGGFAWEGLKDFYTGFLVPVGSWILGEGLPRLLDIITNGLAMVDWQKINDALIKLWEALTPFAIHVGEGLLWCFENVFVPLGVWALNCVVPLIIEGIAAAFGILNGIIEALKPLASWLWEAFLQPLAQWTGGAIASVLEWIVGALQALGNWINEHGEIVRGIVMGIATAFLLWETIKFLNYVSYIGALTNTVGWTALLSAIQQIAFQGLSPLKTAILTAAGTMRTLGVEVLSTIGRATRVVIELAKETAAWIASTAAKAANTIAQAAQTAATVVWNGVCTLATTLTTALGVAINFLCSPIGLVVLAVGALIGAIVLLVQNWDKVKETAQNVWTEIVTLWQGFSTWLENKVWAPFRDSLGDVKNFFIDIVNGMITGFEGFANFLISGINKIIAGLNEINFTIPDEVLGIGGISWGFNLNSVPPMKLGRVPKLATGAVIPPNQEFLAVLGDQRQGRNFEAPEGLLRQIVREEMGNKEPQGGTPIEVVLTLDGKVLARVLAPYMDQAKRQQGATLVRGVTS